MINNQTKNHKKHIGDKMMTMINWFLIPSTNFNRAVNFYSTIFNIEMTIETDKEKNKMAMFFKPGERQVNGAITSDKKETPSRNGVRIYLNCDKKLDEVLNRVIDAGGNITIPKTNIGEWGHIAIIDDSEGNSIGLHAVN